MASDIKKVLELHNKAFNAQDLKAVMETYASGPNVVLMGTGPGESYVAEEAIGGAYNQFFNRFEPNTLEFKNDWIAMGTSGNTGWFAVTTSIAGTIKNEKQERVFNISCALEKQKGKWRIASMHFSRLGAEQQQTQ